MNGRYRVTVLAVELYDPLLIQHAISRAGGDGARTGATLAVEVPGGFGPAVVAASSSRAEADRLLASLTLSGIEAIIVDDGHPLLNKLRRAWMRLEGRDPDAKTTAPEQRPPELPVDPLAPPGSEPDRVNFKLHRNAERAEVNPIDAVFGELRVHLVRLAGLIVVILLFALPWYFMLGRVSKTNSLKGGGGGEEVLRLVEGSGGAPPKVTLKGGPSDGSGGDPQREAEQMAAGAGSGDDGKSGPPGGKGGAGPSPLNEPTEAGGGNGPGGGKGGAPGSGDPNAANDQLKRTALLLTIAGLLGLVAGLVAGWLSFSRGKPGLRVVKSTWFWVAAAALVGGIALGHLATRQAELKKVAATVQHEGSGSGSGSGDSAGSGSSAGSSAGSGSGSAAADGSGSGATAPRAADAAKSVASQVAAMQGPPRANLAELLRKLREKQAAPAKAQGRKGASKTDRPAPGSASAPSATGDAAAAANEPPSGPATGQNRAGRGNAATPPASAPTTPANSPAAASSPSGKGSSDGTGRRRSAPTERPATNPSEAAAAAPDDDSAEPGTAGNAAPANAPSAKSSPVESKVAAMGEPPCEAQRSPYKAMLCKLRKSRTEAAAKTAADQAAAAKPGADPNRPGAAPNKPGADKSAPGNPTGGKGKKGNQPPANSQQPPMSPNLVAGVGFSVGLLLGLLFSLFYHRFYRR